MKTVIVPLLETLIDVLRSRVSLHLEMLAMRQQLAMVADGDRKRLSFRPSERIFWMWLYRLWPTCLQTLMIFKPELVEAFPFDTAPRYLLRDRDSIYGNRFRNQVKSLGISDRSIVCSILR